MTLPIIATNLSVFGYTAANLPILSYEFGSSGPEVLILGGVHGDEYEGVMCGLGLLDIWLRKGFNYNLKLTLIPQFNLDGILNKNRLNSKGVDLNRNLPTRDWSPEAKTPRYQPGPHPASEPENQALIKYLDSRQPRIILSLHSWKPMININGDCLTEAKILEQKTGYSIETDIGYPTPGSLGTYGGLEGRAPTITLEIEQGIDAAKILSVHVPAIQAALFETEKRS